MVYRSSIISEKQTLSFDSTSFEIDEYIPSGVEESDCSYEFDLESIIREERHEWKESE